MPICKTITAPRASRGPATLSRIPGPHIIIDLASRSQCAASDDPGVPPEARFLEGTMRDLNYINDENIRRYRKLIAISEGDPARDEARHQTLVRLLAEEEAKHTKPADWPDAV
jgi:hypothetical protein